MRVVLALALVLVASQPAQACHRFHVWRYPTPQRCGVSGVSGVTHLAVQIPRPAVQPSKVETTDAVERVTIEITITPELLETWARQDALDKIKGELK